MAVPTCQASGSGYTGQDIDFIYKENTHAQKEYDSVEFYPCKHRVSKTVYTLLKNQKDITRGCCMVCGHIISRKAFVKKTEIEINLPFQGEKSKLEIFKDPVCNNASRTIILCPKHPGISEIDSLVISQFKNNDNSEDVIIVMKFKKSDTSFINFLKSEGFELTDCEIFYGQFVTKSTAQSKALFGLIKKYNLIDIATLSSVNQTAYILLNKL
jgi:hypothetical protein